MDYPVVQKVSSLEGYTVQDLVQRVAHKGHVVESRYGTCVEMFGGRVEVPSGTLIKRGGINLSLGWMETFQLLAGTFRPEEIQRVAPKANHSLFTSQMAYGPRVVHDVPAIIEAIKADLSTRQAVLFVGKPGDGPTSNLPCTTTIQFMVRFDQIHAIVNMRSWDLCRGLPYDLMMFSGLLEMIGRCLLIETGNIIVQAGSTHIYLDQLDKLPVVDSKRWRFTEEVPDTWTDAVWWFRKEIFSIEQGKTPPGIMYFNT